MNALLQVSSKGRGKNHSAEVRKSCTGMWMDLETVIQSEVSQKEKNKYRLISLVCGI